MTSTITKTARAGLIALCLLSLSACGTLAETQQRVASGAAIGAAAGTVGTVIMGGCIACGTVIGGAVGAGAGYVIDQVQK